MVCTHIFINAHVTNFTLSDGQSSRDPRFGKLGRYLLDSQYSSSYTCTKYRIRTKVNSSGDARVFTDSIFVYRMNLFTEKSECSIILIDFAPQRFLFGTEGIVLLGDCNDSLPGRTRVYLLRTGNSSYTCLRVRIHKANSLSSLWVYAETTRADTHAMLLPRLAETKHRLNATVEKRSLAASILVCFESSQASD